MQLHNENNLDQKMLKLWSLVPNWSNSMIFDIEGHSFMPRFELYK